MKRLIKGVVFTAGLLAIPAAINHWIFKTCAAKNPADRRAGHTYSWRHGDIHYVTAGKGRPLLLLHSLTPGGSLEEWEDVIGSLSRRYRVFAPDLLGFGLSRKPDVTYNAYLYVSLINDFVRDVIGQTAGVAASGHTAAYAVLAADMEPELFNRLLLVSPAGLGAASLPTAGSVWMRWLLQSPVLGTTIYNILTGKPYLLWRLKTLGHAASADMKRLRACVAQSHTLAHYGGVNAKMPVAALMSRFLNVNIEHALPDVRLPIHVVWGDRDDMNPLKNYHVLERLADGASLTVFEGAGSLPHIKYPRKFCRVCMDFFSEGEN